MRPSTCLTALTALGLAMPAAAQCELWKLTAPDGQPWDAFGARVSASGSRVIIGAEDQEPNGSARVFNLTTGKQVFKITAPNLGDGFGASVGLQGDVAVIGNRQYNLMMGAVVVFDLRTGTRYRLEASDADFWDEFGLSVALSGDRAIVGATGNDDLGQDSGSAYIFDLNTHQELFKLTASNGGSDDWFGSSVAISENVAVVGAILEDHNGKDSGAAYIFDVATGLELFKLTASDGSASGYFGSSVAVSGDLAIIGAPGNNAGAAYVFDVNTGQQLRKLTAADGATGDSFGHSTAINNERAIVGAVLDDDLGQDSGSAYVFDLATGRELFKLTASDGSKNDLFSAGDGVAITGEFAIVGAVYDDDQGKNSGSAYVFLVPSNLGVNFCTPAVSNSSGKSAVILGHGSSSTVENDLTLVATQLPPEQFGYFLTSEAQGFRPNPGGSQGNLCLAGTTGRFRSQIRSSGTTGSFCIEVDLNNMPPPVQSSVHPGETWNFQCWFRDKAGGVPTSNFTDGIEIVFY